MTHTATPPATDGQEPKQQPSFEEQLSAQAILISDRDYLVNQHCAQLGVDQSDVFAKTRVYSGVIDSLRQHGIMQYGVPIESPPGPTVTMEFFGEKRTMIMLASNDYLNLSTDPRVHEAIQRCLKDYGVGAGSSRVGTGYSYMHRLLEEKLAHSFGKEAALLFPTGFDAIAAPARCLLTKDDRVLIDSSSHACILEGAQSCGATVRVFAHNSPDRLESTLQRARNKDPRSGILVIVEGAYSMDGDVARLPEILKLCRQYGARLLVDEAHSIGVHGDKGHGVCEKFGLSSEVDIIGGTFSKSLGATGGFLAADKDVITYFNYISKKIIFSAALPPLLIAGVSAALDIMENDSSLRERLWDNVRYLANGLRQVGARLMGTETASVPVLIANDSIMFRFTQDLIREGIFTFPAVYPTVPKNKSVFRLALQSRHEKQDLDHVIEVFDRLLGKYGAKAPAN
ncbi:MAG: pyridoxal phosphate-dependent aminotransferase family protein [Bdellovibrionaceae bacterium]|nr:pyridoxal phosphate-dependent aminotransferase family protein [Bdellovibrionales bacterium]MCB9255316.1 pyridoxal phosphate-dependent aminotransferase family protein [Pseudobdellovibrionaceae bacterium]